MAPCSGFGTFGPGLGHGRRARARRSSRSRPRPGHARQEHAPAGRRRGSSGSDQLGARPASPPVQLSAPDPMLLPLRSPSGSRSGSGAARSTRRRPPRATGRKWPTVVHLSDADRPKIAPMRIPSPAGRVASPWLLWPRADRVANREPAAGYRLSLRSVSRSGCVPGITDGTPRPIAGRPRSRSSGSSPSRAS